METVEYKNISFTVWDVGGQDKVFSHYFPLVPSITLKANKLNQPAFLVSFSKYSLVILNDTSLTMVSLLTHPDSSIVEALLPEHPRADLRGGQQRP